MRARPTVGPTNTVRARRTSATRPRKRATVDQQSAVFASYSTLAVSGAAVLLVNDPDDEHSHDPQQYHHLRLWNGWYSTRIYRLQAGVAILFGSFENYCTAHWRDELITHGECNCCF